MLPVSFWETSSKSNSLPLERKYIKSDTCIMLLFNSKYNVTVISKPHTQTFYISCMLHNFMREKNIKLNLCILSLSKWLPQYK